MPFEVLQSGVKIAQPSVPKAFGGGGGELTALMKAVKSLHGGAAGVGKRAAQAKGDTILIPDAAAPGGFRAVWVPGSTEKSRAANLEVMQNAPLQQAMQTDPALKQKLDSLGSLPLNKQQEVLDSIRKQDAPRIMQATGATSSEFFNTLLKPYEQQVKQNQQAIEKDSGLATVWDSVKSGAGELMDAITSIGATPAERLTTAEQQVKSRESRAQNNAFIRDQELRAASGEGVFSRMTGAGSSTLGTMGMALGEMLPSAGAMIGSSMAGAQAGAATGAAIGGIGGSIVPGAGTAAGAAAGGALGGLIGSVAGGGSVGAITAQQAMAMRIASDPTLTREQKLQAISDSMGTAAVVGGVSGAIPLNLGKVGGAIAGQATRAGLGATGKALAKAATPEAAQAILQQQATGQAAKLASQGIARRYIGNTATTAAELSAMNTVDVAGQNYAYGQATGKDVPLTENMGETLAQGVLAAPFFGLLPRGAKAKMPEGYGPDGKPATVKPSTPPPAAPARDAGSTDVRARLNDADKVFNREFRDGVAEAHKEGSLDVQAMYDAYTTAGRTHEQFMDMLDSNKYVAGTHKLPEGVIRRATNYAQERFLQDNPGSAPAVDPTVQAFNDSLSDLKGVSKKTSAGKEPVADSIVQRMTDSGASIDQVTELVLKTPKKELNDTARSLLVDSIDRQRARMEAENVASAERSGAPEPTVLGRDGQAAEGQVDTGNNVSDSGVAPDTRAVVDAVAAEIPTQLAGRDPAVEGRGAGRLQQPDLGTGEAPNVPIEVAGFGPSTAADAGRRVETAALTDAAPGRSPGELGVEAVRSEGNRGDAANTGRGEQPAGSAVAAPDVVSAGIKAVDTMAGSPDVVPDMGASRAAGESGVAPHIADQQAVHTAPGETALPVENTPTRFALPPVAATAADRTAFAKILRKSEKGLALTSREQSKMADIQRVIEGNAFVQDRFSAEMRDVYPPKLMDLALTKKERASPDAAQTAQQRVATILAKDALEIPLSRKEQSILAGLEDREPITRFAESPQVIAEAAEAARTMGDKKISADEVAAAKINLESTIEKVVRKIWCGA